MVISGLPQGSILDHVLFLIYINVIDEVFTCKIAAFANDMNRGLSNYNS